MAHPADILMDITSANTIITIQADPIIPSPVQLQNFIPDGGFSLDYPLNPVGVSPIGVSLTFEANSPELQTMFDLAETMRANRRIYDVTITATCLNLKKSYIFEHGSLISGSVIPISMQAHTPTTWKFLFATMRKETIG